MQETDGARPAPDPLGEVIAGYPDDVRALFGARTAPLGRLPATADRDLAVEVASLDDEIAALRRAAEFAARMREAEDDRRNREDSTNELCGEAARAARRAAFKAGRAFKTGTRQAERREFARRLFGIQRDGAVFDFVGGIAKRKTRLGHRVAVKLAPDASDVVREALAMWPTLATAIDMIISFMQSGIDAALVWPYFAALCAIPAELPMTLADALSLELPEAPGRAEINALESFARHRTELHDQAVRQDAAGDLAPGSPAAAAHRLLEGRLIATIARRDWLAARRVARRTNPDSREATNHRRMRMERLYAKFHEGQGWPLSKIVQLISTADRDWISVEDGEPVNLCPEFLHGKPAPPTDESDQAKQLRYSGEFKAFEDRISNLISKDAKRWRDEHKAERYDDLVQLRGYIEDGNADER